MSNKATFVTSIIRCDECYAAIKQVFANDISENGIDYDLTLEATEIRDISFAGWFKTQSYPDLIFDDVANLISVKTCDKCQHLVLLLLDDDQEVIIYSIKKDEYVKFPLFMNANDHTNLRDYDKHCLKGISKGVIDNTIEIKQYINNIANILPKISELLPQE